MNDAAWLWAAKLCGAVAGSAISLAYILPAGRRDAAARFAVGVVCGMVFGGTAGLKIANELGIDRTISDAELLVMGSAVASLCAWWALGFIKRGLERISLRLFGPKRNGKDADAN
jgi:undecaprenyl pyrophosphate phosphatase UppP